MTALEEGVRVKTELASIASVYATTRFFGCIGAVDVLKLYWKSCLSAKKGQYKNGNDGKLATVGIESWCDHDLKIKC